ncbi:ketimine reductase mu-crystallin-like isoform X2 [Dysidea avara]
MEQLPFIPASKVKELLDPKKLIDVIEDVLIQFSKQQGVNQPVRSLVPVVKHGGFFGAMPAYVETSKCLGVKLLTFYRNNPDENIASHPHAVIALFEPSTGVPLVVMDGEHITPLRTAAASAVAVKHLSSKDVSVLSIIGTGVEARSHARVLIHSRNFQEIRVWGRSPVNLKKCVDDITAIVGGGGAHVTAHQDVFEAVSEADVIVTVTRASEPIFHGEWMKPGTLVCGVGAVRPDWRELDDHVMQHSWVVVDSREGALKESGDVILSKAEVYAELGEVAAGTKKLPSFNKAKKFVVFKSLGMAIEDVTSAKYVYDLSKQHSS